MSKIRVLFQGDSITDAGRNRLSRHSLAGYAKKTAAILEDKHPDKYDFFNRGVSGNRTKNLLARYRRHFVRMRPNVVTVMIGINDVWRKYDRNDPTSPEQYEANLIKLLTGIKQDTGAKIVVMSPYLTSGTTGKWNVMRGDVDIFINVCEKVAMQYADKYINTDGPMNEANDVYPHEQISADGVHPAEKGQEVLATLLSEAIDSLFID